MQSIQELARKIKTVAGSGSGRALAAAGVVCAASLGSFFLGRLSTEVSSAVPMVTIIDSAVSSSDTASVVSVAEPRVAAGEADIIASKNGTKYYLPWCSGQSRILEENKVRFASETDAVAAGYEKASGCKGL